MCFLRAVAAPECWYLKAIVRVSKANAEVQVSESNWQDEEKKKYPDALGTFGRRFGACTRELSG